MSAKIPKTGAHLQRPVGVRTQQELKEAKKSSAAKGKTAARGLDADVDLPERLPGLSSAPSQLQSVIQAGLNSLAQANNWEATDNALGVLVKAMVGAGKGGDSAPVPATLPMEFQRLLKTFVPPGDATALIQLKKDAQQLVKLSVVALGTEGFEGLSKSKQEAQLEADVRAIHGAISDVLKLPADARADMLGATEGLLTWKANVLDRAAPALNAAGVNTPARIDALAAMMKIVGSYAAN